MQNITPIGLLSAAIRRERERLNLSVTELAKRAGIAKSTLSQLEAGSGNPSLETLWALAMALDVPVSRLISQPSRRVQVIRAHEGTPALSEQGNYAATLLATCPPGRSATFTGCGCSPAKPNFPGRIPGTVEHVIISSGRARLGPADQPLELSAGDYISYSADREHVFEALEPETTAVMLIEQG